MDFSEPEWRITWILSPICQFCSFSHPPLFKSLPAELHPILSIFNSFLLPFCLVHDSVGEQLIPLLSAVRSLLLSIFILLHSSCSNTNQSLPHMEFSHNHSAPSSLPYSAAFSWNEWTVSNGWAVCRAKWDLLADWMHCTGFDKWDHFSVLLACALSCQLPV